MAGANWMRVGLLALALAGSGLAEAKPLTAEAVNQARLPDRDGAAEKTGRKGEAADPLLVKLQVLLDRARFSPGAIDGKAGDNFRGALSAYATAQSLPAGSTPTPEIVARLEADAAPAITPYTITRADADTRFLERVPPRMEAQAELDHLGYTNAREMLAERFHMSRELLSALNPGAVFDRPGTVVQVAAVTPMALGRPDPKSLPEAPKVARIEVDKGSRDLRAFDGDGRLVAYYPASIGSTEKPAPSGETTVTRVAFAPSYTYDPKYAFKGVKAREKFTIKPGPNNPVGDVWIDLAIDSYGIHGTPEPEKVGKTESHGCIRLTNWGARDLGRHVGKGVKVVFKDG